MCLSILLIILLEFYGPVNNEVMSSWSIILPHFKGKFYIPELSAHPFASNIQLYLFESAEEGGDDYTIMCTPVQIGLQNLLRVHKIVMIMIAEKSAVSLKLTLRL